MYSKNLLVRLLGNDGYYCIIARKDERIVQKFHTSIDYLLNDAFALDRQKHDVSFSLATYKTTASRKAKNACQLKSFFMDLDCGDKKDFPTQEAALNALKSFCVATGLPKPTIVSSGYGLHTYWVLTEPVSYEDWHPVALGLKQACIDHELKADLQVISDASRALRVPDTHNYKKDTPVKVSILSDKVEMLSFGDFQSKIKPVPVQPPVIHSKDKASNNLMGNRESVFKDILIKSQRQEGCPQLLHIAVKQEEIPEPLWRAGLSIANACSDRATAIHKISDRHPNYTHENTEAKASATSGPYTCASFNSINPGVCQSCPNFGKVKSPIVLGSKVIQAEVKPDTKTYENSDAIPEYPKPYFRGKNGGVYIKVKSDDDEYVDYMVYNRDIYVTKRVRDPEDGDSVVIKLHLPHETREFTLPMSAVTSTDEFRRAISKEGATVVGKQIGILMQYILRWVNEMQEASKAENAHVQFGWADSNMDTFILGNRKITADKVEFNPPSSHTRDYFKFFEPKGTLQAWKDNLKIWENDKCLLQQFALGMGFGSPLMELLNTNCGTVSFYSKESGVGKTVLLLAAMGIWGDPKQLVLQKEDTYAFKMNRSEVYHSIPVPIDEITNMQPTQISDLVYQGTSGQQRGRMAASVNLERHRGERWSLLMMYTANTSIVERISLSKSMPKAEAQRVLECHVDPVFDKSRDKQLTDAFENSILSNYGCVGESYIQYVINNLDGVKKFIFQTQTKIDNEAGLTAENRFWSATVAATLTGLWVAKNMGLHNFDLKAVYQWTIRTLIAQNQQSVIDMATDTKENMANFFYDNISRILRLKNIDGRSSNGLNSEESNSAIQHLSEQNPGKDIRDILVARYYPDTKRFSVRPAPLKQWCGERQVNYGDLVKHIIKDHNGKREKKNISTGTNIGLPPCDIISMDFEGDEESTQD